MDLNVLLPQVDAAGLPAFNPVERRTAPLSHDLAGVVLPYDHFDHLDSSGKTIDCEMDDNNFHNFQLRHYPKFVRKR